MDFEDLDYSFIHVWCLDLCFYTELYWDLQFYNFADIKCVLFKVKDFEIT